MISSIMTLILGMAVVTYIPRAIPTVFINKVNFSLKVEKFLSLIPYTAMAALVFPGILTVDASAPYIGVWGGLAAGGLAWKKFPIMVCVIGAIVFVYLLYLMR